jgi:amidase
MSISFNNTLDKASAIKAGRVSSAEVLEAHLRQIDRFNPGLNTVITLDVDGFRARTHQVEEYLSRDQVWRPFLDKAFTFEDTFGTAGVRTTNGFSLLADSIPREDSNML